MPCRSHILIVLATVSGVMIGQPSRRSSADTLAWVDGTPIVARELRARIELMPWPGPLRPSTIDSVKAHALSSLIAERLLATEGILRGLASDQRFTLLRWGLTSALLKDALFQHEVSGKSKPDEKDVAEALRRYRENRKVLALMTSNRSDADSVASMLRRALRDGAAPVELGSAVLDQDTIAISFGMTDTLLERMAYEIGPSRVLRPRQMTEGRWIVVALLERSQNPAAERQGIDEQRRVTTRILQQRLDARTGERFFRTTLADKRAQSDPEAFQRLARIISEIWLEDSTRFKRKAGFELSSEMVDIVHQRIGEWDEKPLVAMDGEGLTLGHVIEMFRYETFVSPEASGPRFENRLNERVRSIVAGEYLARMARERGLASSPSVQADLRSWSEYWAAGEMVRAIRDTIQITRKDVVDELIARRETFRGRATVLTEEVWTTDAREASALTASVLQGTSIASLASGRTRRLARIAENGLSGWFDPADDPVVGFHALIADSGSIVGPVAADGGYVTFRVLGVREHDGGSRGEALQRTVEPLARSRMGMERVNAFVAELAQRRQVRVDADAVGKMTVTSVPMFTRRYLGFGGWMNGAPMLLPYWEWVRQLPPSVQWPL